MTYKFKAGETYRMRGRSGDAVILAKVRDYLVGYIWEDESPTPERWMCDGVHSGRLRCELHGYKCGVLDLLPPKRQVWVAVYWSRASSTPLSTTESSEALAKYAAIKDGRIRIAILGPIDVEGEP